MHWGFDLLLGQIHMLRGDSTLALKKFELQEAQNLDSTWPAVDLVRCADIVRCRACVGVVAVDILANIENRIRSASSSRVGFGDIAISANSLIVALKSQKLNVSDEIKKISDSALQLYLEERENQRSMLHDVRSDLTGNNKLRGIINWPV